MSPMPFGRRWSRAQPGNGVRSQDEADYLAEKAGASPNRELSRRGKAQQPESPSNGRARTFRGPAAGDREATPRKAEGRGFGETAAH